MTDRPNACPACGGETIPLEYGYPDEELFQRERRREVAAGGCVIPPPAQEVGEVCRDCGREFADPSAWTAEGLLARAMELALDAHAGQLRKGTPIPYVAHPMAVASLVMSYGGSPVQAAAALLHDVVEDSDLTVADVQERFGREVAELVGVATDAHGHPKPPWRDRKEAFIERLGRVHREAALVIACDKLHNAQSIVADHEQLGDELWGRFTAGADGVAWYYPAVAAALEPRLEHPRLARDLWESANEVVDRATGSS